MLFCHGRVCSLSFCRLFKIPNTGVNVVPAWVRGGRLLVSRGLRTPRFNSLTRLSSGRQVIIQKGIEEKGVMNGQNSVCAHPQDADTEEAPKQTVQIMPLCSRRLLTPSLPQETSKPLLKEACQVISACLSSPRRSHTRTVRTCMKEGIHIHLNARITLWAPAPVFGDPSL